MVKSENDLMKEELANWINSIDDLQLLNLLNKIKTSSKEKEKDWWNELSEDQKENIQIGIQDMEEGRVMSSEDFWSEIKSHA